MTEWRKFAFGDIVSLSNGTNFTKESFGAGLKILGVRDFGDRTVPDWSTMQEVKSTALGSERQLLEEGDLVFVRSNGNPALVGRSLVVTAGPQATHSAFTIKARPNRDMVEPRFLAYQMRNAHRVGLMRAANGTNITNLSQPILSGVPVLVPSRETQLKVLGVLGPIDDLIENNQRRAEVLEEMARTLHTEWFVKFRYPGHEHVPLIDSSLGPIPEGWEVRAVADLSSVVARGISPRYSDDGPWTVLNQKCIRNERVSLALARRQERQISDAKRVRQGDVLINSTGVGTLGRVALYRGLMENLTADSHVTIARPSDASLNPWYGLGLVSKQPILERLGTGSTGQTELRRGDIGDLQLALPSAAILAEFASVVWTLLRQADALLATNTAVASLRDILLPKLVTGKIDVSALDFDGLVDRAVTS